jgi:hypothetical protein
VIVEVKRFASGVHRHDGDGGQFAARQDRRLEGERLFRKRSSVDYKDPLTETL